MKEVKKLKRKMKKLEAAYSRAKGRPVTQQRIQRQAASVEHKLAMLKG